ncbi:MAG TPA: MBL fold metallo-hydrolase [Candidatus Binataceae bacterium]|nr:MBL fold metallo-hydrolase [Candidatus Binataceae bacterium]
MPAKVVEVHPGIFEIFLPLPMRPTIINVYLVDCHGAWVLVDTGMNTADSVSTLEDAFAQVGIKVSDLDLIIATHHHIDHFGASGELAARSGAKVYLHELEAARANRMVSFGRLTERPESLPFFRKHGFPIDEFSPTGMRPSWMGTSAYKPVLEPDQFIKDGDVIPAGDREFEVIWTPGHSPGHNVIYLGKEKVMIVGDHLLPKITPHVGIYPDAPDGNPLGDFINSQLKVQRFDVELVLPAHGGVYQDHRHRANQIIEHHRYREAEMLDLVRHRPQTAFEVAQQVFGNDERPVFVVMSATFETLAHLEYACLGGRARKTEHEDRVLFQAL